ncbi:MAG: LemA family protein [Deltaproteobacteria bacterium]|nr:LemA family protein [Deltaproteobacteria bacterium]
MKKGLIALLAVVGIIGILVISIIGRYNGLVDLEENVNEKWAQVENVYQRRLDLIPNLVNTVKGYASHEKETLEAVVKARASASQITPEGLGNVLNNPQAFEKFQAAQSGLSSALSRLMVVVERYPELKANQNFLNLQSQLEGTENRIAVERMRFNESVREFNSTVRKFPTVMIAGLFGFQKKNLFEASEGAEKAPEVKF